MTFDPKEYAAVMHGRVKAATAGDEGAARFLLEEFVNHADCFRHRDLQDSDRIVLDFVVRSLRQVLEGVELRKALCLSSGERGRRPTDTLIRDMKLALAVLAEVERLRASTVMIEDGVTKRAQERIADRYGFKRSLVRSAWEAQGGEKNVQRLRDEFFPQRRKPRSKRI